MADRAAAFNAASDLAHAAAQVGDFLVVLGWFGALGVALIAGVAYLRWRS